MRLKRFTLLPKIMVIVFCLAFVAQAQVIEAKKKINTSEPKSISGNTNGNIINGGIAAEYKKCVYYRNDNVSGSLYSCNDNGSNSKRVCDDSVWYINIYDDWIYYSNASDSNKIYKIRTNGSKRTKVINDSAKYVSVVDGWIYYSNLSDLGNIYKMKIDGTKKTKLTFSEYEKRGMENLNIYNNQIYYKDGFSNNICRIDTNGKNLKEYKAYGGSFIVEDNLIYFLGDNSEKSGLELCKMKLDGTGKAMILANSPDGYMNISGNSIYYSCNMTDILGIWKVRTDGQESQWLTNEFPNNFNIVGGLLIYNITDGGKEKTKIVRTTKALSFIKSPDFSKALRKCESMEWIKEDADKNSNVTRKQFAQILANYNGDQFNNQIPLNSSFSDTNKKDAAFQFIESQKQYIPFNSGSYKPDQYITREDAITAILLSMDYRGRLALDFGIVVGSLDFLEDNNIKEERNTYVEIAVRSNLIDLVIKNNKAYLRPKEYIKMQELASLLYEVYKKGNFNVYKDRYLPLEFSTDVKDVNFQKAQQEYFHGLTDSAEQYYSNAIDSNPQNAIAYYNKAWILSMDVIPNYDEIIKLYDKAISIKPSFEKAYFNKGSILWLLGKKQEAINCFNEVLKINKDNISAYYAIGNIHMDMSDYKDAVSDYDNAILINPKDYKAYLQKGISIMKDTGDEKLGMECFEKAIKINPNYMDIYLQKGYYLTKLKKYEEALECYQTGIGINPYLVDIYDGECSTYYFMKQYDKAIDAVNKGISIIHEYEKESTMVLGYYGQVYYHKGYVLLTAGKYSEALECFNDAIKVSDELPDLYYGKGLVLMEMGKFEDAVIAFDNAININPNVSSYYLQKCLAYQKQKKYGEALKSIDKAVGLDKSLVNTRLELLNEMWMVQDGNIIKDDKLQSELYQYVYNKINLAIITGKQDLALEYSKESLSLAKTNQQTRESLFQMGITLYAIGDVKNSIENYKKCISLYEKDISNNDNSNYTSALSLAYTNLSLAELYDMNFTDAVSNAKIAVKMNGNTINKLNLANALLLNDQYEEAVVIYSEINNDNVNDFYIVQIKPMKVLGFPSVKNAILNIFESLKRYGIENKNMDKIIDVLNLK